MSTSEDRYLRQETLSCFTKEQLENIKCSTVICIGAGGVASSFLEYISAAGCKHLVICDCDIVEVVNLHR